MSIPSWHLLADRSLTDRLTGSARLRLHTPVPREIIPVVDVQDGTVYRYMTVFKDAECYRMYYALIRVQRRERQKFREPERICYAESRDGIHWEKPVLRLIEHDGSRENNILWMEDGKERLGISGFSPFRDERPGCPPEERYKAIAEAGPLGKAAFGRNGLVALTSPDGIRWRMLSPDLVMTGGPGLGGFDSQNLAFWDAPRGEYRLYRREVFREGPLNVFRDVLTATSPDFLSWSEPQRLAYPGAFPDQLYTNNVTPYFRAPELFLAFPARYVERPWGDAVAALPETDRRVAVIRSGGAEPGVEDPTGGCGHRIGTAVTDTVFMSSRDGLHFDRWDEAFIRPGLRPVNNWFYADNFTAWGMLPTPGTLEGTPGELSFYVTEGARRESCSNLCRRYTLRMDGFVSVNAGRHGGEIVTRALPVTGRELRVNFSASAAGSLRIGLLDEQGWPIPGFELEQGVELLGDDLERRVQWKSGAGETDLSSLEGRRVRLKVVLVEADLFSFAFR